MRAGKSVQGSSPVKARVGTKKKAVRAKKSARGLTFVRNVDELDLATAKWRSGKGKIALVPTMGALHAGHLALVEKAREISERTIVSIYVNPQQFAAHEDLDTYPRDEAADGKALEAAGVDLVWAPSPGVMYSEGFATHVSPSGAALGLETDFRPHFFGGVTTVVLKLFNQVKPDIAVFGEKDYQQLCVVRQMVRDFDLRIEIVGLPTVREVDGLALSSRNAYLSDKDRGIASELNRTLRAYADIAREKGDSLKLRAEMKMKLLSSGFDKVDYIEARDEVTLVPFEREGGRPGRVLAAAWIGGTRLIDNVTIAGA